jgi:ubiquinone/menaquinone biosynthesis C-methylase UbiE
MTETVGPNDTHLAAQRAAFEEVFSEGTRSYLYSTDPRTVYITYWRLRQAIKVLRRELRKSAHSVPLESMSLLVLCSGEGAEGSALLDIGFSNVTVSDITEAGCRAASDRDPRLHAMVLNAERADVPDKSFDLVLVQDGLHHLSSPVAGFLESLRIGRRAVVFLEPHNSLAGRSIGRSWEVNGSAVNWVFRWDRDMVEQMASSYLGPNRFRNASFSFWHHNVIMGRVSRKMGRLGLPVLRLVKAVLKPVSRFGNQFCGIVILHDE